MKIIKLLLLINITALMVSCEPEADLYRHFVIKEGEHYASPRVVESLQSNSLTFYAKFDATCIYTFENQGFQDSKNKLFGFSDCNAMHHENSARFAWQWYNNRLEIYAYCYVNGNREEKFVGVVEVGAENKYEIQLTANSYRFYLNNEAPVEIMRGNTCDKGMYYLLWPYFGGTLPAPHDVYLSLRRVY